MLYTGLQKYVIYGPPKICYIRASKNMLYTGLQKYVIYRPPKIYYIQASKNMVCDQHGLILGMLTTSCLIYQAHEINERYIKIYV